VQPRINVGVRVLARAASENSQVWIKRKLIMKHFICALTVCFLGTSFAFSQAAPAASGQPFVIEYYYKAKWGHADEFLQLFRKNHYPLLKREVEMGRMLKVWIDQPRYHTTETAAGIIA
jgi:hypothetical protein